MTMLVLTSSAEEIGSVVVLFNVGHFLGPDIGNRRFLFGVLSKILAGQQRRRVWAWMSAL